MIARGLIAVIFGLICLGRSEAAITGVAKDLKGNRLPGLDVEVFDESGRKLLYSGKTGTSGEFSIADSDLVGRSAVNPAKPLVIRLILSGVSLTLARETVILARINADDPQSLSIIVPEAKNNLLPIGCPPAPCPPAPCPPAPCPPAPCVAPAKHSFSGHGLFRRR